MTEVLVLNPRDPDRAAIARAAAILRDGGLVAFPTETVYGLGAHALDRRAVQRIFEVKGRPAADPLIVHIHDICEMTALVADIPSGAHDLASQFWPGPLTIVLRKSDLVPADVTAGLDTIAIRIPAHPIARALLSAAAVPVAAPSANLFSRPSPTRAEHVLQDLDARIDLIVDGGPTTVGVESTVVDLTGTVPTILRPGAVTLEMIQRVMPDARLRDSSVAEAGQAIKSPGLLSKHYSPVAPLTLYEGSAGAVVIRITNDVTHAIGRGQRVGIVAADEDQFPQPTSGSLRVERLGSQNDAASIAANLYNALRRLDAAGVDVIFARGFPHTSGLQLAIHDRLRRAAAGRIVHVET